MKTYDPFLNLEAYYVNERARNETVLAGKMREYNAVYYAAVSQGTITEKRAEIMKEIGKFTEDNEIHTFDQWAELILRLTRDIQLNFDIWWRILHEKTEKRPINYDDD